MSAAAAKREPDDQPHQLPPLEVYAPQFRAKFGREMTQEERRFYNLTRQLLGGAPEQDDGSAA